MRSLPILIVMLAVLAMPVAAEVPINMSYQGVLRDDVGNVVPDADYSIEFRIYDAEIAGALQWNELLTVSTSDGVFDAVLGEVTPLHIDFDAQYWLALSVAGEAELSPRVKLTAAPYAHRATAANELRAGGSINVTGFRLTTGAASGHVLTSDAVGNGSWQPATGGIGGGGTVGYIPTFTGAAMLGDSPIRLSGAMVGIGTVPSATLHVNGTIDVEDDATFHSGLHAMNIQSSGDLQLKAGDHSAYLDDGTGNLGIGTAAPSAKLTVSSSSYNDHILIERPGDQSGHISVGGGNLLLWMGSGSALAVNGSGNVGVGVAAPVAKLDVAGTAQVAGFRMPTGASDGHVLVSDASGNASWDADAGLTLPYAGSASVYNGHVFHITNTDEGYAGTFIGGTRGIYASAEDGNLPAGVEGRAVVEDVEYEAIGVYGYGKLTSGSATGVSYGIYGIGQGNYSGLQMAYGVRGSAQQVGFGIGVYGDATSIVSGGTGYGVYGTASGGGTLYAGYFEGNVHVNGTLSKSAGSFRIDHPLDPANQYLSHSFVESPDMMNVYNGNVVLDARGEAWVELPDYFDALNREFRYQLTPVGGAAPNLHIADRISGNRFRIAGGAPGLEVSWQVTGIRQDQYAEEHRIQVEEFKSSTDQGKYLSPELFGMSERSGIHYIESAEQPDAESVE